MHADLWSFNLRDCRSNSIFSTVLALLGRPLCPLFRFWQVPSRTKHFHNCSLTRAGKLPQRPAQRRIISGALAYLPLHILNKSKLFGPSLNEAYL
jgi:hypothetical protein